MKHFEKKFSDRNVTISQKSLECLFFKARALFELLRQFFASPLLTNP